MCGPSDRGRRSSHLNGKIRVGLIMPELFYGGAETQFRMLVENIDTRRFDVTVFVEQSYGEVDRSPGCSWMQMHNGIKFVLFRGLSVGGRIRRRFSAAKLALLVLPHLRRTKFDAVVVYSSLGLHLTPLLKTLGIFAIFSERNAAAYSKIYLMRRRVYFSAADAIVCNSIAASDSFVEYGYRPRLIENAVNIPQTKRVPRASQAAQLVLLVPGRIVGVKNQALVLRALPALAGVVSKVIVAGAIEDVSYLKELQELVRSSSCAVPVDFLGFVRDMELLYQNSDLVVLPSRAEGMPNVLLEALARGIPCLASDIPSNRQVLRDERFLFGMDDPDALADCVWRLTQLPPKALQKLTQRQRKYVEERFGVETMVASYEKLFAASRLGADAK